MTAQINNNGDTMETLIDQHLAILEATKTLIQAMRNAAPNGRNYQTHSDLSEFDRDVRQHLSDCSNIQDYADRTLVDALAIQRQ